jgi:hypothetical protein
LRNTPLEAIRSFAFAFAFAFARVGSLTLRRSLLSLPPSLLFFLHQNERLLGRALLETDWRRSDGWRAAERKEQEARQEKSGAHGHLLRQGSKVEN